MALHAGVAGIAEQATDVAIALLQQVADQLRGGTAVVQHHRIGGGIGADTVDHHHREAQRLRVDAGHHLSRRRKDHAGHALFLHQAQVHRFLVRVFVGVAQDHAHAVAVGLVLHRAADRGKERVADIRHDQSYSVGVLGAQPPRRQIRAVVQPGHRRLDPLAHLVADRAVAQHPGDG
ncbi:hypothetical protein D3C85_1237110 [compost metagenome]